MMAQEVGAFVRRDYLTWVSYRFAAFYQVLGVFAMVAFLYLLGETIGGDEPGFLDDETTGYAGFLLTSLAFIDIWSLGLFLPRSLRESQQTGTLEAMLLSHLSVVRLVLYSAAFPFLQSAARLGIFAVFAITVFGIWQSPDPIAVFAVLVVGMAVFMCIGLLSAAFILTLKQGDPVLAVYGLVNMIFAGVFFPPDALPDWLRPFSALLPLTHALEGMRQALGGANLADVATQVIVLLGMFVVLMPFTVWALNWSVKRAKEEGSLVQY